MVPVGRFTAGVRRMGVVRLGALYEAVQAAGAGARHAASDVRVRHAVGVQGELVAMGLGAGRRTRTGAIAIVTGESAPPGFLRNPAMRREAVERVDVSNGCNRCKAEVAISHRIELGALGLQLGGRWSAMSA